MFALFEDDFTIIHWTAGFAAFGSSTSGYGYSPPSATPSCSGKRQRRAQRRLLEIIHILNAKVQEIIKKDL